MPHLYRTFVKLDEHERWILKNLQVILRKANGKKPSQTAVIRGVLRDYWDILQKERDRLLEDQEETQAPDVTRVT